MEKIKRERIGIEEEEKNIIIIRCICKSTRIGIAYSIMKIKSMEELMGYRQAQEAAEDESDDPCTEREIRALEAGYWSTEDYYESQ